LDVGTAKGESAAEATDGIDDSVTGYVSLVRVLVKGISDGASGTRASGKHGELAVGGDFTSGDLAGEGIYGFGERDTISGHNYYILAY